MAAFILAAMAFSSSVNGRFLLILVTLLTRATACHYRGYCVR